LIFQGLFNILDLFSNEIDLFYGVIDKYFREKIRSFFDEKTLEPYSFTKEITNFLTFLTKEFIEWGFDQEYIENKFSDQFLIIRKNEIDTLKTPLEFYEKKLAPIIIEIFLEKIVDYLVDNSCIPIMLKLKSKEFLPIEFIMELRNLKSLFEKYPDKVENLRKYLQIREKIISKFSENKEKIEKLEDLHNPHDMLQLIYLIYRIIAFFNLQKYFDFSNIGEYIKNNINEWLISIPLISLRNPDIYFCGIYLAHHLNIEIDQEKVKEFLLNLYEEHIDEFEAPLIEATDRLYYYFKSTELVKLWLDDSQINELIKADAVFFDKSYLKNLETSQLVVILKIYKMLGLSKLEREMKSILEEIEKRVSADGIKQFRDGFISSEATYYVLFCNYMKNSLEKLKDYDLLKNIVSRIYRNLEILDFSSDTNYDLVSELTYSLECLKLFNCIETKQMIIHLTKYLFPDEVVDTIIKSEEITYTEARFRHLRVNRITGDIIY